MSGHKSSRGRPKGSGLDDQGSLSAIAKLMASDPDLKPTTAIKKLGITDPSVIRRLRDKFQAFNTSAELLPAAAKVERKYPPAPKVAGKAARVGPVTPMTVMAQSATKPAPKTAEPRAAEDWLAAWGGLGLRAVAATVEVQIALLGEALRLPPVTVAMRQHVLFNELALSLYFSEPEASKSLH